MITAETVLLQIEFNLMNSVGWLPTFHFVRRFLQDGVEISRETASHSVTPEPGVDLAAYLAKINTDITTRPGMLWPAIAQADWDRMTAYCAIAHTPEVKVAYAAFKAAQAKLTGQIPARGSQFQGTESAS